MNNLLKGNFEPASQVVKNKEKDDIESRFEKAALATLGGSIGFVSRKNFVWIEDGDEKEMKKSGRASQYDKD
ncbi:MAG: hypothetical protein HWE34_05900 [Methylocystaceae bacterium]|nr:hypothetical protein [Methylocystaceae bacterium]